MDAVLSRKSTRRFAREPVSREQLELLLKAAMQAPSAHNQQPWEFIVVTDPARLQELSRVHRYSGPMAGAAAGILALRRAGDFSPLWPQDLSAAVENILIEAEEIGLGAVWMGIHPDSERVEQLGAMFSLPQGVETFAMIAVGVPETRQPAVSRYDPQRIHWETY
ncbi:MAG: nitroreductase family protein [Oscillospiraceae bacterium]|nr:nitroreductase family protein [Oscillospiraceae bacterium]